MISFLISSSNSSEVMRIIFVRTIKLAIGIIPHNKPITRHFIPICVEVKYTHKIPFQKKMAEKSVQNSALKRISRKASGNRLLASSIICQVIEGINESRKINRTAVP